MFNWQQKIDFFVGLQMWDLNLEVSELKRWQKVDKQFF
jgi:hypothetical protein